MLFVYLYDNDLTSPSYEADLSLITSGISILWELHGGVRTIEFNVMMGMSSAFNFYSRYLGYRVIILDNALDIPVADCFITGYRLLLPACVSWQMAPGSGTLTNYTTLMT